jgi:DinB superfamily
VTTVTQAVEELVRKTIGLTDDGMGREWKWGAYDEEGLRFALLMTHHELRDLAVRLAAKRPARTQASAILAQYHQAYRDLTGALASARTEDLDRAPAEGEWPVREVAKHALGAEYGFLMVSRFGLDRRRAGKSEEPPEAEFDAYKVPFVNDRKSAVDGLSTATVEQLRDAFATVHIRILRELGDISDDEVEAPAWFWDGAMPLRFRLHRFEEHLRQHTIQLDKTLGGIGRPPTEAHRLVRNVYNALADVETEPAQDDTVRGRFAKTIAERAAAV